MDRPFTVPGGPDRVRDFLAEHGASPTAGPIHDGPGGLLGIRSWWPDSMADPDVEAYGMKDHSGFGVLIGVDAAVEKVCFYRNSRRRG